MKRRDALQRVALLMGGIISAPTVFAFADGNKANLPLDSSFKFTKEQATLVSEFAEVIIPKTNTPGAKDAKVGQFIEVMLRDCYTTNQQNNFLDGIKVVEAESAKLGGKFATLPPAKKTQVVKAMQDLAKTEMASSAKKVKEVDVESGLTKQDAKAGEKMTPFFTLMKELTLMGYFSSEVGATKALNYVPIPGRYDACIKIKPGQKAYAI